MDIFDDVAAEYAQFDAMLGSLTEQQWLAASGCPGWTMADVVLHLAQSEDAVALSSTAPGEAQWRDQSVSVDAMMAQRVAEADEDPQTVLAHWRASSARALDILRNADPQKKLAWAGAPLKPATLATTRIAEHWGHASDIALPLGYEYPDTDRVRHVAWLGHSTLPYALGLAGIEPGPVRAELTLPSGSTVAFGPEDAPTRITGPAAEFCRIGARRIPPEATSVRATGPLAEPALRLLRNYAQ